RFKALFPCAKISVMPNMKFDTISVAGRDLHGTPVSLPFLISSICRPLSILASVREEEESDVLVILDQILSRFPEQVVGLFPRHMHRIEFWKKTLAKTGRRWMLRSEIAKPLSSGTVILWDTFGELKSAYALATVAFVGGSLKPLGGHNFIEPIASGVATVIGPFVDDFAWVGEEIFSNKVVRRAANRDEVVEFIVSTLKNPPDRKEVVEKGLVYLRASQGGTAMACNMIRGLMQKIVNIV
ncbi:MAG: 3-deoxy-D-manno-octulosonic acid transferase, partial [Desulfamplus sp.]|nr:3-deoxy-D-manno-octulosonic acid transferase [Desulfamplus sp.]